MPILLFIALLLREGPASAPDWPTASAASAGLSETRLAAMQSAVAAGEFKQITSVLVARNGKLVFESYFNGADAATSTTPAPRPRP